RPGQLLRLGEKQKNQKRRVDKRRPDCNSTPVRGGLIPRRPFLFGRRPSDARRRSRHRLRRRETTARTRRAKPHPVAISAGLLRRARRLPRLSAPAEQEGVPGNRPPSIPGEGTLSYPPRP
ncbi:hypothetical protein IscW_ISCW022801, partial [Ixodes scapularis]